MPRIICPHCLRKLESNNTIHYLLSRSGEEHIENTMINEFINSLQPAAYDDVDTSSMNRRYDINYAMYWDGVNESEKNRANDRIVLTGEELIDLLKKIHNGNSFLEIEALDAVEEVIEGKRIITSRFHLEDMKETIAVSPVCYRCHNVLPNDYAINPSVHIGLIGDRESGKTSFICAVEKEKHMGNLSVASFLYDRVEENQQGIDDEMLAYSRGKSVKGTEFCKNLPVFFITGSRKDSFHVVLHDISGEFYRENEDKASKLLGQMDAFVYLKEVKMLREGAKSEEREEWKAVLENAGIDSVEMQAEKQSGFVSEKSVSDMLPKVKQQEVAERDEILQKIIATGNYGLMNHRLREEDKRPFVYAISKADRLQEYDKLVSKYEDEMPLLELVENADHFLTKEAVVKVLLESELFPADRARILQLDSCFEKVMYAAVSAYGGEPIEGREPTPYGTTEVLTQIILALKDNPEFDWIP